MGLLQVVLAGHEKKKSLSWNRTNGCTRKEGAKKKTKIKSTGQIKLGINETGQQVKSSKAERGAFPKIERLEKDIPHERVVGSVMLRHRVSVTTSQE